MKTLNEHGAAGSGKSAKSERKRVERASSFKGISEYIGKQVRAGKDDEAVFESCRSKYPGCGKAWCNAVADRKREKLHEAETVKN